MSQNKKTLRHELGSLVIPRLIEGLPGQTATVMRSAGEVFIDELEAAQAHHGRPLLAGEADLLAPFVGRA